MAQLDLASALKKSVSPKPAPEEPRILHAVPQPETGAEDTPAASAEANDATDALAAEANTVEEEEPTAVAPKAPKPRKRTGPKRAPVDVSATEAMNVGIAIELPVDLDARLTSYRQATRKSLTATLLDAVESTYEQLPELIANATGRATAPKTNLFDRSPRLSMPVNFGEKTEKVRHTIRITASNRALLDEITEQFGAPSRNFLVVTAYDAYLPMSN